MIIILEGVNGVGKTTIASIINEIYNIQSFRCFSGTSDYYSLKKEYTNKAIEELAVSDFISKVLLWNHVVLDRSLISSYVYNTVYKHDATIFFDHSTLDNWVNELHTGVNGPMCIVNVKAPKGTFENRELNKSGMFSMPGDNRDNIDELLYNYNIIFNYILNMSDKPYYVEIMNDCSMDDLKNNVEKFVDELLTTHEIRNTILTPI